MNKRIRSLRSIRHSEGNGVNFRDYLRDEQSDLRRRLDLGFEVLRRRRWLMLSVFLGLLAASVLYVLRTTPEYASESLLLVENRQYDPSNALTMGYIPGIDNVSTEMQLEILAKSPVLARTVADRVLDLNMVPGTDERFSILEGEERTNAGLAAHIQQNVISISPSGTNIIAVRARTASAPEAAFLANAFAEEAVSHSREISRQRIATSRQFLEQRIGEGRQSLLASEQNMQRYMNREGTVALDQEVSAAVSNLSRVESALSQAQIDLDMERASLLATEAELARIKPVLSQRVASGIDREIATAQQRVAELEVRLETFYQAFPSTRIDPDQDPRTAPVVAEIRQWQERIKALSERYVQELLAAGGGGDPTKPESGVAYAASLERQLVAGRITISGLESKIAELERQRSTYEARLASFPEQSVELANLQRTRESSEQLYSYLEQRLHEAMLAEQSETGSLRVLRQAGVAVRPLNPRPERIIPLTAFLALVLSIAVGIFSNKIDRRIYTPTDVKAQDFHLVGVIPEMKPLIRREFRGASFIEYHDHKVATTIVGLTAPLSAPAEAYRQLYARLHSGRSGRGAHTIVVTSPEAGVGKSTTAINIAVAGALARRRTLIVDIDLRRPAVEHYLGIPLRLTLQDLLELPEGVDPSGYIAKSSATGIPNLHALTVREPVGNPIEHLVSPRLRTLVELFKKEFEIIIFDAPPLLLTSDATLLTWLCDVTIVVAAAGKTDESALHQIHAELREADAHQVGVVLNRFDSSNRNFKSTYGYLSQNYGEYYGRADHHPSTPRNLAR